MVRSITLLLQNGAERTVLGTQVFTSTYLGVFIPVLTVKRQLKQTWPDKAMITGAQISQDENHPAR